MRVGLVASWSSRAFLIQSPNVFNSINEMVRVKPVSYNSMQSFVGILNILICSNSHVHMYFFVLKKDGVLFFDRNQTGSIHTEFQKFSIKRTSNMMA